jgi:hypothetical protein
VRAIGGAAVPDLFNPDTWQPSVAASLSEMIRLYGRTPNDPQPQARALLGTLLGEARAFHQSIEALALPDSKRWLSIVGIFSPTRVGMSVLADPSGDPRFVIDEMVNDRTGASDDTGDNTVGVRGARSPFIPAEEVVCVTVDDYGFFEFEDKLLARNNFHSAMPNMNLVHRFITTHLRGEPYGDIVGRGRPLPGVDHDAWSPPIPIRT